MAHVAALLAQLLLKHPDRVPAPVEEGAGEVVEAVELDMRGRPVVEAALYPWIRSVAIEIRRSAHETSNGVREVLPHRPRH